MRRTVPPSAEIEEQIDRLLAVGVGENPRESLSELAKLGARLIIWSAGSSARVRSGVAHRAAASPRINDLSSIAHTRCRRERPSDWGHRPEV